MLEVALKEWAAVCELLIQGRQAILLRKGGIHESGGPGVFELEHPRFLLFPSWLHHQPEMLRPTVRDLAQSCGQEPATITLRAWAEVTHIWRVPDRTTLDALGELHHYQPALLDMRWNYKPANPLYVVALRVHRLTEGAARTIANTPAYGGCRSWVPLSPADAVQEAHSTPVLDEQAYARVIQRVQQAMEGEGQSTRQSS